MTALRNHGMLSIGLYRLYNMIYDNRTILRNGIARYLDLSEDGGAPISRYVITNPPNDFNLHPTDKVFVFMPYSA